MAVWNAEQVADLSMCESSDDGGNESSVVDSEDSEFRISSSGGEDPTVSSETESTDSENRTYVTCGRSRARGRHVRTRGGGVRTRGGSRGVCVTPNRSRSVSPQPRRTRAIHVPQHDWTEVAQDPPDFPFTQTPGLINPVPNGSPAELFELFVTPELIDMMVTETNRYAAAEINKQRPLRRHSRLNDWRDTNAVEMKKFLALLLHMGPVSLPTIEHYWSTNNLYKNTLFGSIMSRNRFQLLLRFWHFTDNANADATDRLYKLRPVLEHFNHTMDRIYYPRKELSIDESMVLWRGRLVFRQYIKNRRHKYDNYYNSVGLVKRLTNRSTYICGTLRFDRKENPKEVASNKLKKGEHAWKRSESVVVCKWKDKRDVLTISNMHRVKMINVVNRRQQMSIKPNIVQDYNDGMSGVDTSDQMLSYYSGLRKTLRWYKKMGLHILEVCVINAHILHSDNNPANAMKLLEFREAVTTHLLGDSLNVIPAAGPSPTSQSSFHYLEHLPTTEKKERPTKRCRICSMQGLRRETLYVCAECPDKPALCVEPCFRQHHVN
ncbi:piggyBac transposable element-derived protein 4-like [Liolophura sinensis]|uniref:piggyBac transposable element-derived protein 4-like n=1 Tax=Liolophura sinensis TaxID=3198878 RepID=UPI003158BAA2